MKRIAVLIAALGAAVGLMIPAIGSSATQAQTVRVNEVSYRITLSAKPRAGVVKFVVRNAGDDPHDFWVRGGGKTWKSRVLGEGSTATLTARLKKGVRYTYWCGVSDHAEEGMRGSFVAR
jgi:hypothetical protein